MSVEFPSDLQDFFIKQGRSVVICSIGDDEALSDEEALVVGQGWQRVYSDLLAKLAQVAKECLYILSLSPSNPAPAAAFFSKYIVDALAVTIELNDLFMVWESPRPSHYFPRLYSYELMEDPEGCRRYFELLVELGQ